MYDPWRVAQIEVGRGLGSTSLMGSGYLAAPGRVLTAAHILAGARSIRVLLDVGQDTEVEATAEDWWADPRTDLAVVMIPVEVAGGRGCNPAMFGRISGTAAVLPVQASGFPVFKLRATRPDTGEPEVFRDFEQASGHAPVAANRRQGTLAVYLDDPAPDPHRADGSSPWAGMSGAAVWVAGRIVGVVAEHYQAEGAGRLTARRIDQAYDQLRPADLSMLTDLLGLPDTADGLRDVGYATPSPVARTAYLAQVRDIAPDELVGRGSELAQWAEFCAGLDPYAWWQAGPWAGKSALASWFVTHPPAGVDVASFFITSRLKGQADSSAFLDAMTEQLGVLADPADRASAPAAWASPSAWLSMLESATARSAERGRRLVVVVDGLDEDEAGAMPGRGRVSIASLLPRRPPPGARFIITSRPDPGLPEDVPADHPLRACQPVALPLSWAAREAESLARQELRDLFSGDQAKIDTVGYIAGSGGGLTCSDLSDLTGAPPILLDGILRGVFGRSLHARSSADPGHPGPGSAERVYLFGHETLRVTAEEMLGPDLARYRQKVYEWMDCCAEAGWPDTTPGYAIRGYPRLLADTDLTRLSVLAYDQRRHEFLLRVTGSDHAALTEITTTQQLIAGQHSPNLKAVVELAARRHALAIRNQLIPEKVPLAWARLGRFDHAEALARSMPSPNGHSGRLMWLAIAIAEAGDYDRAEAIASTLRVADGRAWAQAESRGDKFPYIDDQPRALTRIAEVIAEAGDYDRAEAIASALPHPRNHDRALARVAVAIARAGHRDRAAAVARIITEPDAKVRAFADLAVLAAEAGDHQHAADLVTEAEPVAYAVTYSNEQARMLADLAAVAATAGDHRHARELATQSESIARALSDPYWQAERLAAVAALASEAGDNHRARQLTVDAVSAARAVTDPRLQAQSLQHVAAAITDAGDYDAAEGIARTITSTHYQSGAALRSLAVAVAGTGQRDRAETLALAIADPRQQADALKDVARVIAESGDHANAEALARTITNPGIQAIALADVARKLAEARQHDRAVALARTITVPDVQASTLGNVAASIAAAGDCDRAEALARTVTDIQDRLGALIDVAVAIAQTGDHDRASRLASEAETNARDLVSPYHQVEALGRIAVAVGQSGDRGVAEAIADTIVDPFEQAWALAQLAVMADEAGDRHRARLLASNAESLARRSRPAWFRLRDDTDLAVSIARVGDHHVAEILARAILRHSNKRVRALSGIAAVMWQSDGRRARELAAEAEDIARAFTDRREKVEALCDVAAVVAEVGDCGHALELAAEAQDIASTLADSPHQPEAQRNVAAAIAQAGEHERAEALARSITDPYCQAEALIDVAVKIGNRDRFLRLAAEAEGIARTIGNPFQQARVLSDTARAMAQAGYRHRAKELAADAGEIVADLDKPHPRALADLACTIAQAGDSLHATRLLARALIVADVADLWLLIPDLWWLTTISRSFPADIGDALEVLIDAYDPALSHLPVSIQVLA